MNKLFHSPPALLIISLLILCADALSKYYTHLYLPLMHHYSLWYPYGGIPVFKNFLGIEFSIIHQINSGAAWGMLSAYQMPLLYFRLLLIGGLGAYLFFFNKRPAQKLPFALILTGAIGNVLDYYLYGHVVDMLHFVLWEYDFPVFNLADSAIFVGILSLLLIESFEKRKLCAKRK